MSFKPEIGVNEEIKFIGSYDRSKAFVQQIPGYPGGNGGLVTNIAGVCSNTLISNNYVATGTGLIGSAPFADETYSMVSYSKENDLLKLGTVIWSGTYREEISESGQTAPSIQDFVVTGATGIYSGVSRVIIDFNNIIRVVYFIGPKLA